MIHLKDVSKKYGQHHGLNKMTLTIEESRATVLIGPSGCGKSTLLRLIVGLISPTTGQIFFNDEEVCINTINQLRGNIGYVIQDGGLFPHLTVKENVSLPARLHKDPPEWIEERITTLCDLVKLPTKSLESYPLRLSGGERQRVSIMRALMLDPNYILMDEPLGSLDPITRFELQEQLKEIFSEVKKTVVLVTHDMREAAYLGDEIVLMREGLIVQRGTFQELIHNPAEAFVTNFIQAQQYPLEKLA